MARLLGGDRRLACLVASLRRHGHQGAADRCHDANNQGKARERAQDIVGGAPRRGASVGANLSVGKYRFTSRVQPLLSSDSREMSCFDTPETPVLAW